MPSEKIFGISPTTNSTAVATSTRKMTSTRNAPARIQKPAGRLPIPSAACDTCGAGVKTPTAYVSEWGSRRGGSSPRVGTPGFGGGATGLRKNWLVLTWLAFWNWGELMGMTGIQQGTCQEIHFPSPRITICNGRLI